MRTNELKKGDRVRLRNGWFATIMDNRKGNVRLAEVEGIYKEIGSVYAHDIIVGIVNHEAHRIEHTPAQIKLRQTVGAW